MDNTSRRSTEEMDAGFGIREWLAVLLTLGCLALGATAVFGAAYWLMTGQ